MATIFLTLKLSALIATLILPLRKSRLSGQKNNIELSDWVVNEKGRLESQAETGNPIKIKH